MLRFQFIEEFEQVLFAAGGGTPVQIDDGDPLLAQALGEEFPAPVDHLRRGGRQAGRRPAPGAGRGSRSVGSIMGWRRPWVKSSPTRSSRVCPLLGARPSVASAGSSGALDRTGPPWPRS